MSSRASSERSPSFMLHSFIAAVEVTGKKSGGPLVQTRTAAAEEDYLIVNCVLAAD